MFKITFDLFESTLEFLIVKEVNFPNLHVEFEEFVEFIKTQSTILSSFKLLSNAKFDSIISSLKSQYSKLKTSMFECKFMLKFSQF